MKTKQVTLTQTGFFIEGTATINLWGGGQGEIPMTKIRIDFEDFNKANLLGCVNDGQFGCESIEHAYVDIYNDFDHGAYQTYNRTIEIKGTHYRNKNYFCNGVESC